MGLIYFFEIFKLFNSIVFKIKPGVSIIFKSLLTFILIKSKVVLGVLLVVTFDNVLFFSSRILLIKVLFPELDSPAMMISFILFSLK